jgi:hypothetical protein
MSNSVTLLYDPTWRALEWAKQYCASYITNTMNYEDREQFPGTYHFARIMRITYYFANERDATMFRLRWA